MKDYDKLFHYLQPTDAMDRISKSDFFLCFDAVLDSLDKESKGIIIVNEGKDDIVLCPARWFNFCFDDDFGCIVNSALRYAVSRQTYMPEVVARFVQKYMKVLDGRTLIVAIRDIEKNLENNEVKNSEMWSELINSLTARLNEIEREGMKE